MSEFSESFHLRTLDSTKAATLLRDSEMAGYNYEWISSDHLSGFDNHKLDEMEIIYVESEL